jgi:uroporphyrin-III C-methyltransferase
VITGTNSDRQLTHDVRLAAQSTATVVILMGVHKLAEIATTYLRHRSSQTPVAIIQNGTLPDEKVVIGTLEDIEQKAEANRVTSPAIIVIGEVVNLSLAKRAASQHVEEELLSKAV